MILATKNARRNQKTTTGAQNTAYSATTAQAVNWLALVCTTDHVVTTGYAATVATNPKRTMVCTTGPSRGTIRTKAKAPACRNALGQVVAAPTVSGVLSCLNYWGLVRLHGFRMVYGRGGSYPQGRSHGLSRVTNRHAHQLPFVRHLVVLKSRQGATMHRPTVASRSAAPVSQAAPANITPTTTEETQAHALLQAVTSINLAGFYVRRDNVAQARRKLRQALQALNALEVAHA